MKFFLIILTIIFFQCAELRCAVYEADYVPWSGYWWPKIHGGLVTGIAYLNHPAPFEKYDYVVSGTYDGPATEYGREYHYDRNALLWEGLCFCWAAASVMEEEPIHKGVYKGTVFRVGDKKGLLTALYFGTLFNRYSTDTPEAFHQVLENFIADQKTPVIMDLGTGGESWNYPVFKYDTDYTEEGNVRHYTTTIYHAEDQVNPDFVGAKVIERMYYYYFVSDADGNITESGWENGSIPPVNASEPLGTKNLNTGLDYDQVMEIVDTVDDPYEENDTSESASFLSNGRHTMLAINSDYFKADMKKGDTLNIRVSTRKDIYDIEETNVYLRTYTPEGDLIEETRGDDEEQIIATDDEQGSYLFEIAPVDAFYEPEYTLLYQHRLKYQGIFPLHPSGKWVGAIALSEDRGTEGQRDRGQRTEDRGTEDRGTEDRGQTTDNKQPSTVNRQPSTVNRQPSTDRTILSLMDRGGDPLTSYADDPSARHLMGMVGEDFGLFPPTGTEYIRTDSDAAFIGVQIVTAGDNLMFGSNIVSLDRASADIFFPCFKNTGGWKTSVGIINTGDRTEDVLRQSYDHEGQFVASDTIELAPGQKMEEEASSIAILLTGTRTMSMSALSGRECLTGYMQFLNPSPGSKGRALVPTDRVKSGTLTVPHIASDEHWRTTMAVMNTGEEDSAVTFSAYDAEGNLADVSDRVLKAKQNFAGEVSDIFPETPDSEIASMKVTSQNDQPLCGILLYGTTDGLRLAGAPIRPAAASSLYLPHIACNEQWWTGIGLMNAGDSPADISFSLFSEEGESLDVITKQMNPNQRLAIGVRELFDGNMPSSARYMKIESPEGQPISGVYLISTTDGLRLMGDELDEFGN